MAHENEHDLHKQTPEQQEQLPKVKLRGRIGQVYGGEYFPRTDGRGDGYAYKFSVAVHPTQDETVWYKVTVYDQRAEAMQQRFDAGELRVGQEVDVVGRLREREYQNRRTGQMDVDRQVFPFEVKPVPAPPKQ
jgi:hypothetical protein